MLQILKKIIKLFSGTTNQPYNQKLGINNWWFTWNLLYRNPNQIQNYNGKVKSYVLWKKTIPITGAGAGVAVR